MMLYFTYANKYKNIETENENFYILNESMKNTINKKLILLLGATVVALICLMLLLGLTLAGVVKPAGKPDESNSSIPESMSHEGYKLEKVVVLSRHNIRSPLSGGDSLLGSVTEHEWFEWTSPASQLSLRGGSLETNMGQFFRKWLETEGLFPENYQPDEGDVRIYANAKQRTIATAQFFAAGLLPTVNEDVEYHGEFDTMDPVFNPQLTYISDGYIKAAKQQIDELYSNEVSELADNYELIEDVIDMDDSPAMKDGSIQTFRTDDTVITLEKNKEPTMEGSLKTACSVSDALTLQYYEEPDPVKAAFGNSLSEEQWTEIADVKDVYNDVLFASPLVACNVANPLLKVIRSEMNEEEREFTFLCGHDSNIGSVLAALDTKNYDLPATIEKKAPIGVKLIFTKWKSGSGELFWDADLMYQTTDQLRNADILDEQNHPASVDIDFNGLSQNNDSLYTDEDIKNRLTQAIKEYDKLADYD